MVAFFQLRLPPLSDFNLCQLAIKLGSVNNIQKIMEISHVFMMLKLNDPMRILLKQKIKNYEPQLQQLLNRTP